MPAVHLPDRSLIHITGADAESLLQGIITTDVSALAPAECRPGALLTPQGKILFDFLIARSETGFIIETDSSQREALIRRLTMYKLRAAVDIQPGDDGVTVVWGEPAEASEGLIDEGFAKTGILLKRMAGGSSEGSISDYDRLRIDAGLVVSGRDYALQDAFPHDVLLDLDGGLSFRKGCYVGQEVVSRMQHRGTARRRVAQVTARADLPASGVEITAGGKPVGTLGTIVGNRGLAIVRIDRVGDALTRGVPLLVEGVEVTLSLPAWTGLEFPKDAAEAET